jgi:alkanesulfonate monooxygenase SsuD/methylene tetrahydromethanopterin reductase-like flavin-dependent oxidoreductase (luciferase family)
MAVRIGVSIADFSGTSGPRLAGDLASVGRALDVLSGGRAWLGIGAAWYEQEARALGIPFPPVAQRFEQLEEALQICLQMWSGDETPFRGEYFQLDRPLNHPQAISRPHPPIMIGGAGERKTLRLVARYAQACNLFFPGPQLPHKLEVLRAHCEAQGRDYNEIEKSVLFHLDVGERGERVAEAVDELGKLAELGIGTAICNVARIWDRKPIDVIGSEIIPAVAAL